MLRQSHYSDFYSEGRGNEREGERGRGRENREEEEEEEEERGNTDDLRSPSRGQCCSSTGWGVSGGWLGAGGVWARGKEGGGGVVIGM